MAQRILAREFGKGCDYSMSVYLHPLSRMSLLLVLSILFLSIWAPQAFAGRLKLAWDPVPNAENGCGYKIYYSTSAGGQVFVKDVGKRTSCTLDDLEDGQVYNFAATAYGSDGRESDYSNGITHRVPAGVSARSAETIAASDLTVVTASPTEQDAAADSSISGSGLQDNSAGQTAQNDSSAAAGTGESEAAIAEETPTHVSIVMEAEDGVLSAPMVALPDEAASSGACIGVNAEATDAGNADWGFATYTITVPQTGEYGLWGLISAPGDAAACFVSIDGGEYIIWTMGQDATSSWTWKALNQPESAEPEPVLLEQGVHTIVVSQQGEGARIDKLCIANTVEQAAVAEEIQGE